MGGGGGLSTLGLNSYPQSNLFSERGRHSTGQTQLKGRLLKFTFLSIVELAFLLRCVMISFAVASKVYAAEKC